MSDQNHELTKLLSLLFQAHPWHGISPGDNAPARVKAFIEIVPSDTVKFELDKPSGHLKVDRPQRFSSLCPSLYGFIPQSYCGDKIARLAEKRIQRSGLKGDGDPLDICVISERGIPQGNILLSCIPIGGLLMIDHDEVDDKIIAVLEDDVAFGGIADLNKCPDGMIDRLRHYFLSYKQLPGDSKRVVDIPEVYGKERAQEVIRTSFDDYRDAYGEPSERIGKLQKLLR
jgi:inorganic pyrophosphatase